MYVRLLAVSELLKSEVSRKGAYHGLDIRMRYGVEFVEIEFKLRTDVDIGAFVLCAVTVFWCGEDYELCQRKFVDKDQNICR